MKRNLDVIRERQRFNYTRPSVPSSRPSSVPSSSISTIPENRPMSAPSVIPTAPLPPKIPFSIPSPPQTPSSYLSGITTEPRIPSEDLFYDVPEPIIPPPPPPPPKKKRVVQKYFEDGKKAVPFDDSGLYYRENEGRKPTSKLYSYSRGRWKDIGQTIGGYLDGIRSGVNEQEFIPPPPPSLPLPQPPSLPSFLPPISNLRPSTNVVEDILSRYVAPYQRIVPEDMPPSPIPLNELPLPQSVNDLNDIVSRNPRITAEEFNRLTSDLRNRGIVFPVPPNLRGYIRLLPDEPPSRLNADIVVTTEDMARDTERKIKEFSKPSTPSLPLPLPLPLPPSQSASRTSGGNISSTELSPFLLSPAGELRFQLEQKLSPMTLARNLRNKLLRQLETNPSPETTARLERQVQDLTDELNGVDKLEQNLSGLVDETTKQRALSTLGNVFKNLKAKRELRRRKEEKDFENSGLVDRTMNKVVDMTFDDVIDSFVKEEGKRRRVEKLKETTVSAWGEEDVPKQTRPTSADKLAEDVWQSRQKEFNKLKEEFENTGFIDAMVEDDPNAYMIGLMAYARGEGSKFPELLEDNINYIFLERSGATDEDLLKYRTGVSGKEKMKLLKKYGIDNFDFGDYKNIEDFIENYDPYSQQSPFSPQDIEEPSPPPPPRMSSAKIREAENTLLTKQALSIIDRGSNGMDISNAENDLYLNALYFEEKILKNDKLSTLAIRMKSQLKNDEKKEELFMKDIESSGLLTGFKFKNDKMFMKILFYLFCKKNNIPLSSMDTTLKSIQEGDIDIPPSAPLPPVPQRLSPIVRPPARPLPQTPQSVSSRVRDRRRGLGGK